MTAYKKSFEPYWKDTTGFQDANGSDVIEDFVTNPRDLMGKVSIETKIQRLIEAVGLIADATGINLIEIAGIEDGLKYKYVVNEEVSNLE